MAKNLGHVRADGTVNETKHIKDHQTIETLI